MSGQCDFCSSSTGLDSRGYCPKALIALAGASAVSWVDQGNWVACAECTALIDGERWKALMDRAKVFNPTFREVGLLTGKMKELTEFIANAWGGVFDQPPEVFIR